MTKVDVYCGLLGAGKTTLIKQLLRQGYSQYQIVIIENEIGAVNLDGAVLSESNVAVRELTAGCACCTIRGELKQAVVEICHNLHPDYVILEASGAANVSSILEVLGQIENVQCNRCVLVANAKRLAVLLEIVGAFYYDQIRCAQTIFLNYGEQLDEGKRQKTLQLLQDIHPGLYCVERELETLSLQDFPEVIDVSWQEPEEKSSWNYEIVDLNQTSNMKRISPEKLLYTWKLELPGVLNETKLNALQKIFSDEAHLNLWRAKGLVKLEDESVRKLDWVFGEHSWEVSQVDVADHGYLILIGKKIDRRWLQEQVNTILKTEKE